MNTSLKTRAVAFTLIELSLSLAAAAVILVALFGVFQRALHMRDAATEMTRQIRIRTHVANVIRNDLRGARVSGGAMAAFLTGSVQGQSGSFPGYLKFTTTSARDIDNGDDLATPDVQQVEYYITTDPAAQDSRSGLLVRTVEGNLLAPVQTAPPEDPLLAGVESMEVSFFDGTDWQTTWSATQDDPTVPQAVRVRLQPAAAVLNGPKPPVIEILVPWTTQAIDFSTAVPSSDDPGGGGGAAPKPPATTPSAPAAPAGGAAPR